MLKSSNTLTRLFHSPRIVMKRVIFTLYMLVACMAALLISPGMTAQAQGRHYQDSLHMALNKAVADTDRISTMVQLAVAYSDRPDVKTNLDSAAYYLSQAQKLYKKQYGVVMQHYMSIQAAKINCKRYPDRDLTSQFLTIINDCRKTGDKPMELEAWIQLSYTPYTDQKPDTFKLSCYQHALALCHELNNPLQLMYRRLIADVYLHELKYYQAESELLQILKNPKANSADIMQSSDLLTAVYIAKGDYDKALFYALKTEKTMEMSGDSAYAAVYYGRLELIYNSLGKIPQSLHWAKKAMSNIIITKNLPAIFPFSNCVVKCLIQEKKPHEALNYIMDVRARYQPASLEDERFVQKEFGDCYYALKKYGLAQKSYLAMIKLANEKSNIPIEQRASDYQTMGDFYINIKNYTEAKKYLLEALKDFKAYGWVTFTKDVHLSLFKADSALGNYQSAIVHLQESNKLKDSIFNVAKNKQVEELNISYQTAEREKDLKLVQDKEKLERVQLQHTETMRNWIIAGSALLLVIAALLYRQSRLRRLTNKLITHKNEVITHKNNQLQNLVTEKEWLLKEVHHRVKNNLHSVICLLESQAAYLENDALRAIEESQHRIYAMSLIHQKIYQSDDVKTIDMATYIPELVGSLKDSFGILNQIKFDLDIRNIHLSLSHAIPLALIINEAVTNSIKYAFPGEREGEISITMREHEGLIKLELADNGIGMPQIDDREELESLGLRLMKGLSEDIDGVISFEGDNGTRISITFKPDALNAPGNLFKSPGIKEVYI